MFNFIGYRFVFNALQQKSDKQLVANLDKNKYDEADLVTVTVPLSMPYIQDSKDFERRDGEITLNGKIYHYVKEKISNGNLVLMCLPDEQKMKLQTAKNDFFQTQNDLQNNTSKKSGDNGQVIKLVLSDYEQPQNNSIHLFSTWAITSYSSFANFALLKGQGIMPEQPPEA